MADRNIEMARRIAGAVAAAGGRTYFVGGIVRDWLMGRPGKDVDIEVHGIPVKALEALLDGLGKRTEMGASFGVMGLRHYDIDIAMPRSERATGRGHKDFEVSVDPYIGPERAAMRRDFTINAMMKDVLTGEVLDFFGGRRDLAAGVVRHVSDVTFPEDPLRVFRAAQFAARFGFAVDAGTVALCAGMDVTALAGERVMGELEKALVKAARPSAFFSELGRMNRLGEWFPGIMAAGASLNPTLDAAAALRDGANRPLEFMMAALCLPLEAEAATRLLARLTSEARLTRYALNMAGCWRRLEACPGDEAALMALYDDSVCPEELLLLARAAAAGHGLTGERWDAAEGELRAALALYRERMAGDYLMGRDLVAAGVRPGPGMGAALAEAHRVRLMGGGKDAQMKAALDCLKGAAEGGGKS